MQKRKIFKFGLHHSLC